MSIVISRQDLETDSPLSWSFEIRELNYGDFNNNTLKISNLRTTALLRIFLCEIIKIFQNKKKKTIINFFKILKLYLSLLPTSI
jgi:hypothetical protein